MVWLFLSFVPIAIFYALRASKGSKLPVLNDKNLFELSDKRTKQNFVLNGRRILRDGLKKFGDKPFKVLTDFGYATILPPKYANEVRNIESLSHARAIAKVWLNEVSATTGYRVSQRCKPMLTPPSAEIAR